MFTTKSPTDSIEPDSVKVEEPRGASEGSTDPRLSAANGSIADNSPSLTSTAGANQPSQNSLQNSRLIVSQIPFELSTQELRKVLEPFGQILELAGPLNPRPGSDFGSMGCAVVGYINHNSAQSAIDALHGKMRLTGSEFALQLKMIEAGDLEKIDYSPPTFSQAPTSSLPSSSSSSSPSSSQSIEAKLFVGNLAPEITNLALYDIFKQYGQVNEAIVLLSRDGQSKGSGFVRYAERASAETAIAELNDKATFGGRTLAVTWATATAKGKKQLPTYSTQRVSSEDRRDRSAEEPRRPSRGGDRDHGRGGSSRDSRGSNDRTEGGRGEGSYGSSATPSYDSSRYSAPSSYSDSNYPAPAYGGGGGGGYHDGYTGPAGHMASQAGRHPYAPSTHPYASGGGTNDPYDDRRVRDDQYPRETDSRYPPPPRDDQWDARAREFNAAPPSYQQAPPPAGPSSYNYPNQAPPPTSAPGGRPPYDPARPQYFESDPYGTYNAPCYPPTNGPPGGHPGASSSIIESIESRLVDERQRAYQANPGYRSDYPSAQGGYNAGNAYQQAPPQGNGYPGSSYQQQPPPQHQQYSQPPSANPQWPASGGGGDLMSMMMPQPNNRQPGNSGGGAAPPRGPVTAAMRQALGSRQEGPSGANLFVIHLPKEWQHEDLFHYFIPFGPLISATVYADRATGESRCFGFVSYESPDSALRAITAMDGFEIGRLRLKVEHKRVK